MDEDDDTIIMSETSDTYDRLQQYLKTLNIFWLIFMTCCGTITLIAVTIVMIIVVRQNVNTFMDSNDVTTNITITTKYNTTTKL